MPCYNHEQYVREAILSIAHQNFDLNQAELLITDDGSSDCTSVVIQRTLEVAGLQDKATFISRQNKGLSRTINESLAKAKGKYVAILASDDRWLPGLLSTLIKVLEDDDTPSTAAAFGNGYLIEQTGKRLAKHTDKIPFPSPKRIQSELLVRNCIPIATVYKRAALNVIGGWDESLKMEDWDLYLRLVRKHTFLISDELLFEYRCHPNNTRKNKALINSEKKKLGEKHPAYGSFQCFKNEVLAGNLINAVKQCTKNNLKLFILGIFRAVQSVLTSPLKFPN